MPGLEELLAQYEQEKEMQRQDLNQANLLRGLQGIVAAGAGTEAKTDVADQLRKEALARPQLGIIEKKVERAKSRNPNSLASKDAQKLVLAAAKRHGHNLNEEMVRSQTDTELKPLIKSFEYRDKLKSDKDKFQLDVQGEDRLQDQLDVRKEELGVRKEGQKLRGKIHDFDVSKTKKSRLDKAVQTFNKKELVVKLKDVMRTSDEALVIIRSGNPIAPELLKRKLSKISGETGQLSRPDVEAFGGSQAIKDRFNRAIERMVSGRLHKDDQEDMDEIIEALSKSASRSLEAEIDNSTHQYSQILEIPRDQVRNFLVRGKAADILTPDSELEQKPQDQDNKVMVQTPDGRVGRIPRSKLQKALNSGYKEL